jgi:hypothetical protein
MPTAGGPRASRQNRTRVIDTCGRIHTVEPVFYGHFAEQVTFTGGTEMGTRRVVTGHDGDGRSVIASDSTVEPAEPLGTRFTMLWAAGSPQHFPNDGSEPSLAEQIPPPGGVRTAIIEFPPQSATPVDPETQLAEMQKRFIPNLAAQDPERPGMHQTASLDFGLVLEGEIVMELDNSETILRPGDFVVQNGTMHAWHNRTDTTARILFTAVGAHLDTDR